MNIAKNMELIFVAATFALCAASYSGNEVNSNTEQAQVSQTQVSQQSQDKNSNAA